MKILHVSDLHTNHSFFDWVASHCVEYDLLVIAGDLQNAFSHHGVHDQARAISKWLLELKIPTVVCSGNHDFWMGTPGVSVDVHAEAGWLKNLRLKGNIIGVDGTTFNFQGLNHPDQWLRIAVNGWLQTPKIDGPIDIVVTHAPPEGCACAGGAEGRDNGDPELWAALQSNPPRLILSGHIHAPSKFACVWPKISPTTTVLVPGCDEQSEVPSHWIIDTETKTAVHSCGESRGIEV